MEMCLQQKLNGDWTVLTAITNLNSYSIDSGYRNQTKCYSQPKLYHQGIVHMEKKGTALRPLFLFFLSLCLCASSSTTFIAWEHVLNIKLLQKK